MFSFCASSHAILSEMGYVSQRLLPVVVICWLTAGCELVGAGVMAVSGPVCGASGIPPELENKELHVLDHRFDWDRLDGMIAVLEPYENSHGPDILFALGVLYMRKAVTLSEDPVYFRRGFRLLHWAALCGNAAAVLMLSGLYREGVPYAEGSTEELLGVEKNPERGACLKKVYERHRSERALIPGRVWACGLRMESVPE